MKSISSNQMKLLSKPIGIMNLRAQFFKASRRAVTLLVTGGLLLAAAAQAAVTIVDLNTNSVGTPIAPTPGPNDIAQTNVSAAIPVGSGVGYEIGGPGTSAGNTGLSYSWNNPYWGPGETFTTGATPFELTSVAFQTHGTVNGNDSGTDISQQFSLSLFQLDPTLTTATCLTIYTATGQLTNAGDWLQWNGLSLNLAPNTTYAYTLAEYGNNNNWDVLAIYTNIGAPGLPNPQECIVEIPDSGGAVNYGLTNAYTTNYVAPFDIGLVAVPNTLVANTPVVNSPAAQNYPIGVPQGGANVPWKTVISLQASVAGGGGQPISFIWQSDGGSGNKPTNLTATASVNSNSMVVDTGRLLPAHNYQYSFVAFNQYAPAGGVTSAVETVTVSYLASVDLGIYPSWENGGAVINPTVGANDISQPGTNKLAQTAGVGLTNDGGYRYGLWPAQTFTTPAVISTNSGWLANTLSVKTGGNGNTVQGPVGWGTGYEVTGNLYDVAFYSLDTAGTTATQVGAYQFYGKGTQQGFMQFPSMTVELAPSTTYAFVWGLDGGNAADQNGSAYGPGDNYEAIWVSSEPSFAGQICTIAGPSEPAMAPVSGAVTYFTPANTYDMTFDLALAPWPTPVVSTPTYSPVDSPYFGGTTLTVSEQAVGSGGSLGTLTYQWYMDSGTGTLAPISGATGPSTVVDTTLLSGPNNFEVVCHNNNGYSTSAVLTLNILSAAAPQWQSGPLPQQLYVGETATYTTYFQGTEPISYQWYFDPVTDPSPPNGNVPVTINRAASYTNANTLVLTNVQFSDAGTYTLTATNSQSGGFVSTSANGVLTVLAPPPAPTDDVSLFVLGTTPAGPAPRAYWPLTDIGNPQGVGAPAYDFSGNGFIGAYGTSAENGGSSPAINGPQPSSSPTALAGFPAANTALQTTSADSNSIVKLPAINLNSSSVTMTMWINPQGNVQANAGLLMYRNGSDAAGLCFGNNLNGATAELGYNWNNVAATYNFNSAIYPPPNTWSFVALVIQPTQATLYLDYVDAVANVTNLFVAVNAVTNGPQGEAFGPGGVFTIGDDWYAPATRVFNGDISDVAVYGVALTPAQIMAQFGEGLAGVANQTFAPSITGAPKSGNIYSGQSAQLSVSATNGTPTIGVQWQLDGTNLSAVSANYSGVNSLALTINNVQSYDAGTYTLVATSPYGTSTSSGGAVAIQTPYLIGEWLNGPATLADQSGYSPSHDGYFVGTSTTYSYAWSSDVPFHEGGVSLNLTSTSTGVMITNTSTYDSNYDNTFDSPIVQQAITVMLWAKGWPGGWNPFVSKYGDSTYTPTSGWQMREYGGGNGNQACWTVRDNGAGYETLGSSAGDDMGSSINSNDGNWHHYAGTFSAMSGERNLYVDGVLAAQEEGTAAYILAPAYHIVIGGKDGPTSSTNPTNNYFTADWFNGKIFDVRIYDYAMTLPEVITAEQTYVAPVLLNSQITLTPAAGGGYVGGGFTLTWTGGSLYEGPTVNGPWTQVATTSPYTFHMTPSQEFFRLGKP
jgi:hypothetical protein